MIASLLRIFTLTICVLIGVHGYAIAQNSGNITPVYNENNHTGILTLPETKVYHLKPTDTQAIIKEINYVTTIIYKDIDSALLLLHDALNKSQYLHFDCGIGAAYCNLAACSNKLGDYTTSIQYYRMGLPYALKAFHSRTMMALYYCEMGTPYYYMGKYDATSYYMYKAEQYIQGWRGKNVMDANDISSIYNNIGLLWHNLGNYKKAKEYISRGLDIITPYKDTLPAQIALSMLDNSMGLIYFENNNNDSAAVYYNRALQAYPYSYSSMMGLGKIYSLDKRYDTAIAVLKKAIVITEKAGEYADNMNAKCLLGIAYYKNGDIKKASLILTYIAKNEKTYSRLDLANIYSAYATLAEIAAKEGNYKRAYVYQQISAKLSDSLSKKDKLQAVYELELKSRTAQKDKEIGQKQALLTHRDDQIKRKNLWIGTVSISAILFVTLLIALYRSSKNKQRLQTEKMNALQQEQEINNLRAVIQGEEKERSRMARELHDGIMVQLSTVKMNLKTMPEQYKYISSNDYFQTAYYQQMIQQMEAATKELRQTAHNLMPDMLLAGGLPEAVYYFCKTVKQNTTLEIVFQQNGEIPRLQAEFELSVYRIIQELVQNIIKHAQATQAIVQLFNTDENLMAITIEDNGKGFDTTATENYNGMGLKSIRTRIAALNGVMDLRSEVNNGTTVYLEFDIHTMIATQTPLHAN